MLVEKETACFQREETNVGADSISARGRLRSRGGTVGCGILPALLQLSRLKPLLRHKIAEKANRSADSRTNSSADARN